MKARYLILPGLVFAALLALTTCTDGIYSIIETEKKVVTSTLPLKITIYDIARTAADTYYVAAGGVFKGTFSAGTMTWNPDNDSRPWNPGLLLCNAMAFYAGELWGSFITSGGTLYKSSGRSFAGQPAIIDPAINGKQTGLLQVAGPAAGHLFMGSKANSIYELDYQADGSSPWVANFISGLSKPITGVVWDGVNYWAASGASLYTTSTEPPISTSFVLATSPVPSGDQVNGVFADSARGFVFLATKKNGIYWSRNQGASWSNIAADQVGSVVVSNLCIGGPAGVDATNAYYLVGSDGYGYYRLTIPLVAGLGSTSRFSDSTIGLFSHSVARILVDSVNGIVLMGTHANSLWRAVFDTSTGNLASGQSWVHE